jgi:hypothetical protein
VDFPRIEVECLKPRWAFPLARWSAASSANLTRTTIKTPGRRPANPRRGLPAYGLGVFSFGSKPCFATDIVANIAKSATTIPDGINAPLPETS